MALRNFQFPEFSEWVKNKHVIVNLGDYSALITHLKTHNQEDFSTEVFLAAVYCKTSSNPLSDNIESTTFIYIPSQFTHEDFENAYKDSCDFLNKAFKKYMYHSYWE